MAKISLSCEKLNKIRLRTVSPVMYEKTKKFSRKISISLKKKKIIIPCRNKPKQTIILNCAF